MLTNAAIKAARPRAHPFKLGDAGGLYLFVAPTGLRSWRMKYRRAGREQLLVLGGWPDLALDQARAARDQARASLAIGEDPRATRHSPRTFEAVARAWFEARHERWTACHAADVIGSLERHVFPAIGARAIAAIGADELLALLGATEDAGLVQTARRIRQRIEAVFAFARPRGWVTDNPAALIAAELTPAPAAAFHPAATTIADARAVLVAAAEVPARPIVQLASRFLALTAVRMNALRGARWEEIEELDGDAPVWRVPAARMKLARARKADAANDHLVPLAPAAVEILRDAHHLAGGGEMIFPIGERAIGALYVRAGLAGRHVPHGWRASFSTILNDELPGEREAIDAALAHKTKGKVEAAYNRAEQLGRRRRLFEQWAGILID